MHTALGNLLELSLDDGQRLARLNCPPNLIPSAGQYLLASDDSVSPLAIPLFYTDSAPQGFIAAPPVPASWTPGQGIALRGPFGRGFEIPAIARKIALIAYDDSHLRLRGLIQPALRQGAAVVLVGNLAIENLPDAVELQPLSLLPEIIAWADYAAFDVARENLSGLAERLGEPKQVSAWSGAQVLIHTPVPCGGVAECGVCAVSLKSGWKMACKDGPVFEYNELLA
jgi:dihydroorotate dehydrogenase B-like protein